MATDSEIRNKHRWVDITTEYFANIGLRIASVATGIGFSTAKSTTTSSCCFKFIRIMLMHIFSVEPSLFRYFVRHLCWNALHNAFSMNNDVRPRKKKNTWYFVTNDVTASKRASVSILQRQMLQINLESSTFFLIWYAAFWTFTERNGWKSDKKKKLREGRWKWEKSVQQLVANIRITVDLYLSKLQQVAFLFLINLKNVRNIISHERSMHIYPSSTECRLFDHD